MACSPHPWQRSFARSLLGLYRPTAVTAALAATSRRSAGERPAEPKAVAAVRKDPAAVFRAMGWTPDPWQASYLRATPTRSLLLCCRRAGKSVTSAAKTLAHCLTTPDALVLAFSPTLRQSVEYVRYVRRFDRSLGSPVKAERKAATSIEWANGSRLLALPDSHEGVVGFTPTRVVIDEASRVSDVLYLSLRPMLALGGELDLLSTPFGKRGFFFDICNTPARSDRFRQWRVPAASVSRITAEFLAEERVELGERWFNQEYNLAFNDSIDSVFAASVIDAAMSADVKPLFELGA